MIERIKSLLAVKNLSSSQFANEIGVQRSGISHILSGRNKPSLDFVLKILEHYPEISETWLLKGDGEMYKNQQSPELVTAFTDQKSTVEEEELPEYQRKLDNNDRKDSESDVNDKSVEKNKNVQIEPEELVDNILTKNTTAKIIKLIAVYDDQSFEIFTPRKP